MPLQRTLFSEGQILRAEDLSTGQTYLDGHRALHARGPHSWGVAFGLSLAMDGGDLVVQPGVAADNTGQMLILDEPERIAAGDLPAAGASVWLMPPGADGPICLGPVDLGVEETPDRAGPIFLGTVTPPGTLHTAGRRVTGLRGSAVTSVSQGSRIVLGPDPVTHEPGIRISVRSLADAWTEVMHAGPRTVRVSAPCLVHGDLRVKPLVPGPQRRARSIGFPQGSAAPKKAMPFAMYRTGAELRFEIENPEGGGDPEATSLAVGTSPVTPDPTAVPAGGQTVGQTFAALLAITAGGTVFINGDLSVEGTLLQGPLKPDPGDSRISQELITNWLAGADSASLSVAGRRVNLAVELQSGTTELVILLRNDGSNLQNVHGTCDFRAQGNSIGLVPLPDRNFALRGGEKRLLRVTLPAGKTGTVTVTAFGFTAQGEPALASAESKFNSTLPLK